MNYTEPVDVAEVKLNDLDQITIKTREGRSFPIYTHYHCDGRLEKDGKVSLQRTKSGNWESGRFLTNELGKYKLILDNGSWLYDDYYRGDSFNIYGDLYSDIVSRPKSGTLLIFKTPYTGKTFVVPYPDGKPEFCTFYYSSDNEHFYFR
jgi:hypothetical protein